jgi:tetratricopeptide (TPR) repeat protein
MPSSDAAATSNLDLRAGAAGESQARLSGGQAAGIPFPAEAFPMRVLRCLLVGVLLLNGACSIQPFKPESPVAASGGAAQGRAAGSAPELESVKEPVPGMLPGDDLQILAPAPMPLPRERPAAPPATLKPASQALVNQAQAQRRKGDLPGANVSLERALRIEPNNPLLWIEMGRLRMDQGNLPQAESMGRKALAMSVGDDRTQAEAWRLIGESLKARGKNPQAEEAFERARELAPL